MTIIPGFEMAVALGLLATGVPGQSVDKEAGLTASWDPANLQMFENTGEQGSRAFNPVRAHQRVLQEQRNDRWASDTENLIKSKMANTGYLNERYYNRITCKSTICEIVTVVPKDLASQDGSLEQQNLDNALDDVVSTIGKGHLARIVTRGPDGRSGFSFASYLLM